MPCPVRAALAQVSGVACHAMSRGRPSHAAAARSGHDRLLRSTLCPRASGPGPAAPGRAAWRAGAIFVSGKLVERPGDQSSDVSNPSPAAAEEEIADAA
jgi:hypothetical protein